MYTIMIFIIKKVIFMEFKFKDLSINYEVKGEGKPVLLIHGFCPDHRLMEGCMDIIKRYF